MSTRELLSAGPEELCWAQGTRHRIKAEMQRQEARGDVTVGWRQAQEPYPGVVRIPYVRLRTVREVRRRAYVRVAGAGVLGLGAVGGLGAALWHARFVIMAGAGIVLLLCAGFVITRLIGHRPGCIGLHCPGCDG